MYCCEKCFNDPEIISIVSSNTTLTGKCSFCGENTIKLYDLREDENLKGIFESLIDIYTRVDSELETTNLVRGEKLHKIITRDWNIFNFRDDIVKNFLSCVCDRRLKEEPDLFEYNVYLAEQYDPEFMVKNSLLNGCKWEEFVFSIKHTNRFHTSSINVDILDKLLERAEKNYGENVEFYRARYSDNRGWQCKDMGAPDYSIASSGRANSRGISCLYLANNVDTTFYEIKARTHDTVTVGLFKAKREFKVVDLKALDNLSPFYLDVDISTYVVNRDTLKLIAMEIAKPLKRDDSELDYIPTQYLSDYIKSQGYDGIEYRSTINPDGYNLAIFNQEIFDCVSTKVHNIKGLSYRY